MRFSLVAFREISSSRRKCAILINYVIAFRYARAASPVFCLSLSSILLARPCSTRVLILWMSATSLTRSQIGHGSFSFRGVFEIKVPVPGFFLTDFSQPHLHLHIEFLTAEKKAWTRGQKMFFDSLVFFYKFHCQISGNLNDTRGWHFAKICINVKTFPGILFLQFIHTRD